MAEQARPDWELLADELAARSLAADDATGWFERIYAAGRSGAVSMPWDRPANPLLLRWLAKRDMVGDDRTAVDYRVADLFAVPAEWCRAFDLVVEAITVQALPPARQAGAATAVAELVAPGGTLLVITVVRDASTSIALEDGPPWPLRREDLQNFAVNGLEPVATDAIRLGTTALVVAELRSSARS